MRNFLLRKDLVFVGVLVGMLTFAGCGVRQIARGEIQPPEVAFKGLVLGLPTDEGWPLGCTLELTNPNKEPLDILGYDYKLWLEGKSVAQGDSQEQIYLPPGGQAVVNFPVFVRLPALMNLAPVFLQQKKVNYQIAGGFRLASLLGGFRVPFRFRGQTSMKEGMDLLKLYVK